MSEPYASPTMQIVNGITLEVSYDSGARLIGPTTCDRGCVFVTLDGCSILPVLDHDGALADGVRSMTILAGATVPPVEPREGWLTATYRSGARLTGPMMHDPELGIMIRLSDTLMLGMIRADGQPMRGVETIEAGAR